MKKIFAILGLGAFFGFMVWSFSYGVDTDVWLSSNTATADQLKNLCPGINYVIGTSTFTSGNHGVFHGLCVGTGVAGSSVTVYNSSATAQNVVAIIATSTPTVCSLFDVAVSSGLTYTNGAAADIQILYQCY